jgi:chromosome segregation protein
MYITSLELKGFKSFPETSVLKFDGRITAVVGPNGCGKTNILDSIRWVLGEQKVSLLRGEKMETIIFNGTAELKPLGMAEVALEIDNSRGNLPVEYDQVRITRRLYRSGESEYLINKRPCRLKDISNLIINTGMGPGVYSVIEQRMIDAILSNKMDDRRFLFEEASGISGYKLRRHETLRKLETVGSDLLRIDDIRSEVEKQVNSLKRQSSRAERYKKLLNMQKEVGLRLICYDYQNLQKDLQADRLKKLSINDRVTAVNTQITRLGADLENEKLKAQDLRSAADDISAKLEPVEKELIALEKRYSINEERKTNLKSNGRRLEEEIEKTGTRIAELSEKESELKRDLSESENSIEEAENRFRESERIHLEAENRLDSIKKAVNPARDELEKIGGELAAVGSNYDVLISRRDEYGSRIEDLNGRKVSAGEKIDEIEDKRKHAEKDKTEINETIEKLLSEKSGFETELWNIQDRIKELQNRLSEASAGRSSLEARLETLNSLKDSHEGYCEGTKTILENPGEHPGFIGALIDRLDIPDTLLPAVESALGAEAELILCDKTENALRSIKKLRAENKGTTRMMALQDNTKIELLPIPEQVASQGGFKGRLSEAIEGCCDKPVADTLFGNVLLFAGSDGAVKAAPFLVPGMSIVTQSGDYFRWGNIIGGGSGAAETSVIRRRAAVENILVELNDVNGLLDKIKTEISDHAAGEMTLRAKLENTENELSMSRSRLSAAEIEISTLVTEVNHADNDRISLDKEIEGLRDRLKDVDRELKKSEEMKIGLGQQYDRARDNIVRQNDQLDRAEDEFRELTREVNTVRMELINSQSEHRRLEAELSNTSELLERARERVDQYRAESGRIDDELRQLEADRESMQERIKLSGDEKENLIGRLNEIRGNMAEHEKIISEYESQLSVLRRDIEGLKQQEHKHELDIAEKMKDIKHMEQKCMEEYGVEISQSQSVEEDFDPDKARDELQRINERIEKTGPVNMLAFEQYSTARDRLDFLVKQQSDLTESKESLKKAITEINKTASEKFLTSFELIRQNFKRVFERLFEGGEAELTLVDPHDPLESPIEIHARPRGKKILSLTQLSGGERALTAIALLFGIYFVKPSPFCVLDEIDAPLDDTNLRRFLRLVKEFSANTQFIIITHNKLTMEASDVMYGVTMERPGVSKLVSVRFGEEDSLKPVSEVTAG